MSELGARIRARRLRLGLSVVETARRAGITRAYLHRIEDATAHANPSYAVLERLAFSLGLDGLEELGVEPGASVHRQELPAGLTAFVATRSLSSRENAALQALVPYASDGASLIDWAMVHGILSSTILRLRDDQAA